MTPKPSEVLGVEGQGEVPVEQNKYSTDEWLSWMWDYQVGAIQNPSIQCWICGQVGHIGRNCPSKGKGKGDPASKGGYPLGKGGSKGGPPVGG
eukprot:3084603-Karenia_brevis.AAC.1